MPLAPNARLGPYEIKSVLGVGGMGEVYRARDSRLNRDVALKVLRTDSAAGPDQRSRFEREAHALAALNHPNIVVVHDFGIEDGQPYIVSELVEGESLRALLDGKPVPARRLVDIAVQIADALAAAHAAGIFHRDLKPENLMLTRDGRVKILDFGLARQSVPVSSDETSALDLTQHVTREGAVVGTASYMSPEQALGKAVDYRTDQFSLGLILYELAAGRQAFARPSSVETMAAIVREDPAPIEEKLPAPLKWIIDRCLAKEPEQRYESTRDLYRDLRSLRDHFSEAWSSASSTTLAPVAAPRHRPAFVVPAIAAAGALVLGALLAWILKPAGQDIGRYKYTPFASGAQLRAPVWSPDGKSVAYSGRSGDTSQVFIRYLDSPVPVQITHEPHDVSVYGWSADRNHLIVSESVADLTSRLATVPVLGGDLDFLEDAYCYACAASPDGQTFVELEDPPAPGQLYGVGISHPLGAPFQLYQPAPLATHGVYSGPQFSFSPDGKKFLFSRTGEDRGNRIWLVPWPAGSGAPREVLKKLFAIGSTPHFSWLPDNRHVVAALQTDFDSPVHLWLADTESDALEPLTSGNANEHDPAVSPDGRSVIYSQRTSTWDIVSLALSDGSAKTILSIGRQDTMAAWSSRADVLAWVTDRHGPFEIWVRSGSGPDRPAVTAAQFSDGGTHWLMDPTPSPDGQKLIFTRIDSDGVARLWMISLAGGSPIRVTSGQPSTQYAGAWSPDGSQFVFLEVNAGKTSLKTVRTNGDAAPTLLRDNAYHGLPAWSPDGGWIAFADDKGWNVISPDGKTTKFLGALPTHSLVFSRDSKRLYGIEDAPTYGDSGLFSGDRAILFSIDPATLEKKIIKDLGPDGIPRTNFAPGIRYTLTPDGQNLTYVTAKVRNDLWMLQGFRQPGWFDRLSGAAF
jgi:eukaryotic-like serine/threonine-protein kinase